MEVIPAIDLIDGKCVRLFQGDFGQSSIYSEKPVDQAIRFEQNGFRRLHLVDLDGAKSGSPKHFNVLKEICKKTQLEVDFGGGVRTKDHIRKLQDVGAVMVSIGSLAVKLPDLFCEVVNEFGKDFVFLGLDVKNELLATSGWQEGSGISIFDFLNRREYSDIDHIFCTDIHLDGTLKGPAFGLYQKLLDQFPRLKLVASGGVSSIEDLVKLRAAGISGAIVGKALYEERISMSELKENGFLKG